MYILKRHKKQSTRLCSQILLEMKRAALKHQEAIFASTGFCSQGGHVLSSSCQEGILKDSLDALTSGLK